MSKYTFYFTCPVSPQPTADLKTMSIMQNVLNALEVPMQTHFLSIEDFNKRFGMGGLAIPLGFHVGAPQTDDSFHDLESFFHYLWKNKLWEV
jgi:hypothetical protein